MFKYAILAFIVFEIADAITVEDCPKNLIRSRYLQVYNDKCYYFYLHTKLDFSDANDACFKQGGTLVMVKDKDENKFLHSRLAYTYSELEMDDGVWIGLSDLEKDGTFKWMDGSPMKYENFNDYEGQHASILHIFRFLEDCVAMDQATGKWSDNKCSSSFILFDARRPFICEFAPIVRATEAYTTTPSIDTGETTTPSFHTVKTDSKIKIVIGGK